MISDRWLRVLAPIFLSLLLLVSACTPQTSRYSDIQKETTRRGAPSAVVKTAEQGGTFNQFFPGSMGSYDVVPAQEKKGFAEYKINQDGKTIAMLTINDTLSLPSAAAKYKTSTEKVAGYPSVDQGTTATGILVNDRYQVKVLSRDASFTREDRVAWLQKFDLKGLAKLESTPASTTATPAKPSKTASTPALPKASKTADSKPKLEFPPGLSPQPAT